MSCNDTEEQSSCEQETDQPKQLVTETCDISKTNKENTLIIKSDELSDDFLVKIFLRLNGRTLLNCMRSSRRFYKLLSQNWFWIEYARTHNILNVLPSIVWRNAAIQKFFSGNLNRKLDVSSFDFDLKRIVLSRRGYSPFLLQFDNPFRHRSEEGICFRGSTRAADYLISTSGSGIQKETLGGIGCQPHPEVTTCYAFSFGTGEIQNFIDLVASGIDTWVLDYVRPTIRVSQKVNHRYDCSAEHRFSAQLKCCKSEHEPELSARGIDHHSRRRHSIYKEWGQWTENNWEDWVIEFDNYPSGMRFLTVSNCGGDRQFWNGYYGSKIANITVEVIMPINPIVRALSENTERDVHDLQH